MTGAEVVDLERHRRAAKLSEAVGEVTVDPREDIWARLVRELRAARLDAGDRAMFAVDTEVLRRLLAEPRIESPEHEEGAEKHLQDLTRVLSDALRPNTPDREVRAAADHAQPVRILCENRCMVS